MLKKILTAIACVLLLAGLALLLFPPISNMIGNNISTGEADKFDTQIENIADGSYDDALSKGKIDKQGYPIDKDGNRTDDVPVLFNVDVKQLYEDSLEYNENLKTNQHSLLISEYSYEQPSLDLVNYGIYDGIYGYVYAPTINMKLPIYLGANDATMSYGAAHLTYTSLPVGGDSCNVAIAGHTGYIGRIFFDNLRNLQIGDEVDVKNYWTTLKYKVTETKIINENDSQDLFITKGKDRLTLITCISNNSGGFDRYLVICER